MIHTRVLVKPIENPNPRNSQLFGYVNEKEEFSAVNFTFKEFLLEKYSILHIHWPDRIFYWKLPHLMSLVVLFLMFVIAKFKCMKVVYTMHNIAPKNEVSGTALAIYYRIMKFGIDGVICPRKDLITVAEKFYPKAKIMFIPLGVLATPVDRDKRIFTKIYGDIEKPKSYFFVPGVQEKTKRSELLIDKLLSIYGNDYCFLLAGKFTEEYFTFLSDRYQNNKNVTLYNNYLSEPELAALVDGSKCIVASQWRGTNSGIALLSLAYDKACVCYSNTLAKSIREEYGTQLVWSMEEVEQECLFSLVKKPSDLVKESPTMDVVASLTVEFYANVRGY